LSAATLELIPRREAAPSSSPHEQERSGPTLEDVVLAAWEDLGLRGRAACLVCEGWTEPSGCPRCGSSLE
jgi:hypothetical protein